jgi:hypothetical protein
MHDIDHVLRTIRHVHYGTNFIFFILLSRTFRRRFQQIFVERFVQIANRVFRRTSINVDSQTGKIHYHRHYHERRTPTILSIGNEPKLERKYIGDDRFAALDYLSHSMLDGAPNTLTDIHLKDEDEAVPIITLEHNRASCADIPSRRLVVSIE